MDQELTLQQQTSSTSQQQQSEPTILLKGKTRFPKCQIEGHDDQLNLICLVRDCQNFLRPLCNDCIDFEQHSDGNQIQSLKLYLNQAYNHFQEYVQKEKVDIDNKEQWLLLAKELKIMSQNIVALHDQIMENITRGDANPEQVLKESFEDLKNNSSDIQGGQLQRMLQTLKQQVQENKIVGDNKIHDNFEKIKFNIFEQGQYEKVQFRKLIKDSIKLQYDGIVKKIMNIRTGLFLQDSDLLSMEDQEYLCSELQQSGVISQQGKVFQKSVDGDSLRDFRNKCDKIGPHIFIVKLRDFSEGVWGGFVPDTNVWDSNGSSGNVATNFTNKEQQPFIFSTSKKFKSYSKQDKLDKAYGRDSSYYLTMGSGRNLYFRPDYFQLYANGTYEDIRSLGLEDGKENPIVDFEVFLLELQ